MFIQTEATPNPATLKFLPGRVVLSDSTFEARGGLGVTRLEDLTPACVRPRHAWDE